MMNRLKIILGIGAGIALIAFLSQPKEKPMPLDSNASVESSVASAQGPNSMSSSEPGAISGSAPGSAPGLKMASTEATPRSDAGAMAASAGAAASAAVDLKSGIFGPVLSVVLDWKENELRAAAEKSGETPEAIRQFSAEMAERMVEVWKDPSTHEAAFSQLALCARTQSLVSPVRALCAANAKRISLQDAAKFQSRFKEFEKNLSPEIREFLAQVKQVR